MENQQWDCKGTCIIATSTDLGSNTQDPPGKLHHGMAVGQHKPAQEHVF